MTLDFEKGGGLIPAIVQEARDGGGGAVLMLGYMNAAALEATLRTGLVTFFSRSRGRLWVKGESSGNRLRLIRISADCDGDAVVAEVELEGRAACHKGFRSCFFRQWRAGGWQVVAEPVFDPAAVYGGGRS